MYMHMHTSDVFMSKGAYVHVRAEYHSTARKLTHVHMHCDGGMPATCMFI